MGYPFVTGKFLTLYFFVGWPILVGLVLQGWVLLFVRALFPEILQGEWRSGQVARMI